MHNDWINSTRAAIANSGWVGLNITGVNDSEDQGWQIMKPTHLDAYPVWHDVETGNGLWVGVLYVLTSYENWLGKQEYLNNQIAGLITDNPSSIKMGKLQVINEVDALEVAHFDYLSLEGFGPPSPMMGGYLFGPVDDSLAMEGQMIQKPSDVLYSLFDEVGVKSQAVDTVFIDDISLDDARTNHIGWRWAFSIYKEITFRKLLEEICKSCKLLPIIKQAAYQVNALSFINIDSNELKETFKTFS